MSNVIVTSELTDADRTFALAVIEYGGNLGAAARTAYGDSVKHPVAYAREKLCDPAIAKYVQRLTEAADEHALISLGSHLSKLAEIRDLAISSEQLKVALAAEKTRGEVAGFYAGKSAPKNPADGPKNPSVVISIGRTSANIAEWSNNHGNGVVIDMNSNVR